MLETGLEHMKLSALSKNVAEIMSGRSKLNAIANPSAALLWLLMARPKTKISKLNAQK